jgi:hypothetical protein
LNDVAEAQLVQRPATLSTNQPFAACCVQRVNVIKTDTLPLLQSANSFFIFNDNFLRIQFLPLAAAEREDAYATNCTTLQPTSLQAITYL